MATSFKRRWSRWAVFWLLLCQIQALSVIDRTFYGVWLGKPGDAFTQFVNISQIGISIILFVTGSRHWYSVRRGAVISLSLAAFLLFSAVWSVDGGATVRTGVSYFFFILSLIGATENLNGDDFMLLLARVCFASAIASIALLVISPSSADGGTGDFIGVFGYKGLLGQAMAVGVLACLHGLRAKTQGRLLAILMIVVFTSLAAKSRSTTSVSVILVFYLTGAVSQLIKKGGAARIVGAALSIVLLLAALVVFTSPDALLEFLGKDPTLTGRTDIWDNVMPYIYQRPWLGWGYAAFWSTLNPAAWDIANALHWFSPEAHNGLLELLLSGGLLGAAWFLYLWVRAIRMSLQCMHYDSAMAITCLSCCAGVLATGVSEQVLLYVTGLNGVFFAAGFFCEQAISRGRLRHSVAARNLAFAPHAVRLPAAAKF